MSTKETELENVPSDGITSVRFCPQTTETLLMTSWDASIRVYDAIANQEKSKFFHKGAVLDGAFMDSTHTLSGGLDKTLFLYDHNAQKETAIGTHDQPIRCVEFLISDGLAISGGWDGIVKVWDCRTPTAVHILQQPGKVFTLSQCTNRIVVGTSARGVVIYDTRNIKEPEQNRLSSLNYQTRCIRCFNEGDGYALASVEGRIAIEYFDESQSVQQHKYAFKCHREKIGGTETIYPVNALAFHPIYGTLASGGADGFVNIWDVKNTRRIIQLHRYQTSISSLSFNDSGTLLAIAASYTFEEGEKESPKDAVYIRQITDVEVKPKSYSK